MADSHFGAVVVFDMCGDVECCVCCVFDLTRAIKQSTLWTCFLFIYK